MVTISKTHDSVWVTLFSSSSCRPQEYETNVQSLRFHYQIDTSGSCTADVVPTTFEYQTDDWDALPDEANVTVSSGKADQEFTVNPRY